MSFIFAVFTIALLYQAFRLMFGGFKAAKELGGRQYMDEGKRYVTKTIHPEMRDLKEGDELLVVNFGDEPKKEEDPRFKLDSPELHNLDPLQKSLRDRINELNEEDDDEDGDVPAVVRR